jgi:hypothetical protein
LQIILRIVAERNEHPTARSSTRTLQSTPESGACTGVAGHKKNGSKIHVAVDTLGHLLAKVTPANEQERDQVADLAKQVKRATECTVEVAFVDQGYTGEGPEVEAAKNSSSWKSSNTTRPNAGSCCCRAAGSSNAASPGSDASELARDYERLGKTLEGLRWLAAVALSLGKAAFPGA